MTIFKDILTGDPMFDDDTNKYEEDGAMYKVYGKSTEGNVGGEGFNLIPEEEEEEEDMESGVDIVLNYNLREVAFRGQKDFKKYLKKYLKKLLEKVPDDKKDQVLSSYAKIFKRFESFKFFQGESADYRTGEAMVGMLTYEGDVPVMYFFRWGLEEEKV